MFPSAIVLDPSKPQQQKAIVLRNPTSQDVIAKIYCSGPVVVERDRVVVKANERLQLKATFILPEGGGPQAEVQIFARGVTKSNLKELKDWLAVPLSQEKRLYRAFRLDCQPQERVFSSQSVVLDLPGNALIRGVRSHAAEEDVVTAEMAGPLLVGESEKKRQVSSKKEVAFEMTDKDDSCTFFRNLMDVIYPPVKNQENLLQN